MSDLKCRLNYKEDKALYGSFKLITGNEAPRMSDPTQSQKGKFKKDKQKTVFKWKPETDFKDNPSITQQLSLESLKNSTLQIQVKIDRYFSEVAHEKVLKKMNLVSRFRSEAGGSMIQDNHGSSNIHMIDEPAYTEQELEQLMKDKEFSN